VIFFIPKRKVTLEIQDITDQINLYKNMSLNEFNGFLENFYNTEKSAPSSSNLKHHSNPLLKGE
jgi:hypothetical protein